MKRAYGDESSSSSGRRDRTPDIKRQRHTDDQQRYQQRYPQQSHYQRQDHQQRTDSYSRRNERYMPPRGPDSYRDDTRRGERDTPTPHERLATPIYERSGRSNDNSSYVRPIAAYVGTGSSADASSTNTNSSSIGVRLLSETKEEDPHRLAQRQKQIDYGKNTVGYDLYCAAVPKHQRRKMVHPMTPDKTLNVSKKAFDGMVRKWRQALHKYDPPELQDVKEDAQPIKEVTDMEVSSQPTSALATTASHTGAAAALPASHDYDMAELDSERHSATTSSTTARNAPALSIYENFVEGDIDDDDDDDLL